MEFIPFTRAIAFSKRPPMFGTFSPQSTQQGSFGVYLRRTWDSFSPIHPGSFGVYPLRRFWDSFFPIHRESFGVYPLNHPGSFGVYPLRKFWDLFFPIHLGSFGVYPLRSFWDSFFPIHPGSFGVYPMRRCWDSFFPTQEVLGYIPSGGFGTRSSQSRKFWGISSQEFLGLILPNPPRKFWGYIL